VPSRALWVVVAVRVFTACRGIIFYITACVGLFWHVSWLTEEIMVTLA
jgi:hypothetical protein